MIVRTKKKPSYKLISTYKTDWIAEESLDKNEYSYLLVVAMVLIWPLSKMNPTIRYSSSISLIASVFLGMSGVFIFPLGFQRMPQSVKEKSLSFLRIMGGGHWNYI